MLRVDVFVNPSQPTHRSKEYDRSMMMMVDEDVQVVMLDTMVIWVYFDYSIDELSMDFLLVVIENLLELMNLLVEVVMMCKERGSLEQLNVYLLLFDFHI